MWQYIPAALSFVSTISQASSAREQNKNQQAWNRYNATMQYNTSMGNLGSQAKLAMLNANMAQAAAGMQRQLAQQQLELAVGAAGLEDDKIIYNNGILLGTNAYNNALLDAEIAEMWEAAELDIVHLENQRARERGEITVKNFSGIELEGGSYEDVMVDSTTQQYLDTFVVEKGAADKQNAYYREIAKNNYNTGLLMQQGAWEGQLNKYNLLLGAQANYLNAQAGVASTLLQGAANLAGSAMNIQAGAASAKSAYEAGMIGADFQYGSNEQQIKNNFTAGLFGSVGMGISAYYSQKQPQSTYNFITAAGGAPQTTTLSKSAGSGVYSNASFNTGYKTQVTLADPGSTMFSAGQ